MVIVITEDDAQNGADHIDAHRSVLMVISPWVKKDYVSHTRDMIRESKEKDEFRLENRMKKK